MTDSRPLAKLRILAGAHAGAEVKLTPGNYSIGPLLESDIVINDWPHPESVLRVQADGGACLDIRDADGAAQSLVMAPFAALAVGVVVLVVAAAMTQWPADVELLRAHFGGGVIVPDAAQSSASEVVLEPAAPRDGKTSPWPMLLAAFVVLTVSVSVSVAAALRSGHSLAMDASPGEARGIDVQGLALERSSFPEVDVVAEEGWLSLRGWVRDAEHAERLRLALGKRTNVRHAYAVVQDVQSMIADRIADAGVRVVYEGRGAFVVTGRARAWHRARRAADQIQAEMRASVTSIRFEFPEAEEDAVLLQDGRRTRSIVYLSDGSVIASADGARRTFSTKERTK